MTPAQKSALAWLRNRGGDGTFATRGRVVLAHGEIAPVMRSTWKKLEGEGLVERYGAGPRIRVTDAGLAVDLRGVKESVGEY